MSFPFLFSKYSSFETIDKFKNVLNHIQALDILTHYYLMEGNRGKTFFVGRIQGKTS